MDAEGGGRITVSNPGGQVVYTAMVDGFNFETGNYLDPGSNETLGETTTRYRDDGRAQFRTVWKSARGQIDPTAPPIAGIDGIPAADGVTTQYVYFNQVRPFPAPTQLIELLGGGTATINIVAAANKLKDSIANGGAVVDFTKTRNGSATVVISPDEKTMNVSIADAMGRSVMNAIMSGPRATETSPNQLLSWTCTRHDQIYNLANFGDVEQTKRIDEDGEVTSSLSDGFGWSVGSLDQDDNLTRNKFDVGGNTLETINALGHSTTYVYDDLGRQTSMTNYAGTTTTNYDPANGRVLSREDAKTRLTYYFYDDLGRQTKVTDRLGQDTIQTFDAAGLLDKEKGHASYGGCLGF